uniref:TFIIS central domain-containing protein n=1 Tax=Ditylenchus dipsaci TaxID=166011 RepID=A0A915CNK9_9BILA
MGSEAPINDIKSERKRVEVRKVIEHHLQLRCKSSKMSFSSKRVKQMCVEIEEELFRLTKEINSKYRNWCRGLLQKLKDESNMFFRKIINEKISVKKLVTMDPEDMVVSTPVVISGSPSKTPTGNKDQSLASASRKPAGGETDNPIVLGELSVTLDGGGEKMAEAEDFDLTPSLVSKQNSGRYSMAKKTPLCKVEVKSALDNILDDAEKDTTGQHNSHLYDANCEICKNKTRSEVVLKERAERMEAKLEAKRQQEQEDLKKRFLSKTPGPGFVPVASRSSYSANRIDDEPEDEYQDMGAGFDEDFAGGLADKAPSSINKENASSEQPKSRTPPPLDTYTPSYTSPWVKPPRVHLKPTTPPILNKSSSSPTLDQFNKPARVESWKKPALIPTAAPISAVVDADNPWLRNNPCIWTGSLSWGRRFDFPCSLTAISNRLAFKLGREMPHHQKVENTTDVHGLLRTNEAREQIWSHRICNHQTIRDGYIFALEPEEPLPKDLHPLEGPGLPDGAEQNSNIILVVIRKVDRQETMSGRTAAKKSESWKNESWRVDRSNSGMETRQLPADNNSFTGDSTPLYSEVNNACGVRVAANRQQPIRQMAERNPYLDSSPHPMDVGFESRGVATNNRKPIKRDGPMATNGYAREKRAAENMPSECEDMGVVKSAAQNAYDGPIDTLQDVLKAISVIEKPSLIVIVVGEYISSHSISEDEREIISQAIKDKSESERLRNQKKFGMQFTNNNNSREERGCSGEKFVMRSTPPLSADEEVDNEEGVQTECTKLATIVDSTTPTEDPVNPTISRSSSPDLFWGIPASQREGTEATKVSSSQLRGSRKQRGITSPPPPPTTPPIDTTPCSPPPPPLKISVQPLASGPVPIAPPSQPSFHCLPMFVPPPPPVPTTPKMGPATATKSRPNEDMDISDEESGSKNTGDDLLPPLPLLQVYPP